MGQLLASLSCGSICLAGFVLLASQPWKGCPGYLPDSCFAVPKKQHRGGLRHARGTPGGGELGTFLMWVGLEAKNLKLQWVGGDPLGTELLDLLTVDALHLEISPLE